MPTVPDDLAAVKVLVLDELELLARDGIPNGLPTLPKLDDCSISTSTPDSDLKLAYVMYTSGSTGTPKGVGISHRAATQSLLAHDRHIPSFSRFLQFAAPTFDVSVFEIFFPLFRGATLVCCNRDEMLDDLPGVLWKLEVDACELTPSVAGSLLRKRENAPGLKLLMTIGEMLSERVIREFGGTKEKPSMLWAMYGPTEATIHCTLVPGMAAESSANQIGFPLDTVSCFVISSNFSPGDPSSFKLVDVGEVGELAVGGHQNAAGYLNRPEQTSMAFVDSPFGPIYRTGDLARLLENGTLECLGRMSDGQVKLRGQRIELGEVEHAVMRTPGCQSAVVAVIRNILVVFCVMEPRGDDNAHREEIQQKCSEWLPAFMVPGDVVVMDQFPRLPSGKVDRRGMRVEYERILAVEAETIPDSDEQILSSIISSAVSEILGFRVGARYPLASAGLDSLGAIRLASRLRRENVQVSAMQVLKSKTIHDLSLTISGEGPKVHRLDGHSGPGLDDAESIVESSALLQEIRADVVSVLPCTPLQSSMLFETSRNSLAYCNTVKLAFSPAFDTNHVEATFRTLVSSTEILRTGFIHHDGQFRQVVFRSLRQSQLAVVAQFDEVFQLSDDTSFLSPLRVQILDKEEPRALLHIHHSIYDGWSMDMILADWAALLRGEAVEPRPQFSQVVSFYQTISDPILDESRHFWTEHLLGWEKTPLPKLCGGAEQSDATAATRSFNLTTNRRDVMEFSRKLGCSPQVPFQAALLWLWSSILGTEDVLIGSVTSGRTIEVADIERTVGPCIASMPLRANLSSVATIADLVTLVQSNNRAIIEHAVIPLSDIRKLTTLTGNQSIYDLLFVYQESLVDSPADSTDIVQVSHLDALETPILLEVEPRGDHFICQVTYHSHLIQPSLVEAILKQFDRVVDSILKAPTTPQNSIRNSFPVELQSIYNPHMNHYAGSDDLAAVVETTVRCSPWKPAVHFARQISDELGAGSVTVSFGELNGLANQIARWILESDPQASGGIVAIVMDKSALLYASILGILKAGCAYLPILPSTPIARIQAIIEQSGANTCLSDNASYSGLVQAEIGNVLDVDSADLAHFENTNLRIPSDPNRAAYVIYTSGTTGKPKGVVITTENIVSHLDVLEKIYPVEENSRLLQSCSQAFDVSVFEIFFAWKTGMCVCSAANDVLFDDLERAIRVLGVTHLSMTPTVASIVRREAVPRVCFLVTAGEPMTQAVFEEWKDVLYQGYGPSETTNICTVKKMADGGHIEHLGFAFNNTSAFVLYTDGLTPAPIGCVGELCFGGDQVAQGYLNEPELTASKFISHPTFGQIYRSGDLGRMLPDGSLLIMGRLDDQIKLRGQRIDVGEISSIITRTGQGASSVVLTVSRGKAGPKQLAAFYTKSARTGSGFQVADLEIDEMETQSSLFAALESLLPSYMVPSYLIPISYIPMTSSGKIEKKLLASVYNDLSQEYLEKSSRSARVAQNGPTELSTEEVLVSEAISAALNVDVSLIGRWTPLASVGLDSITAISVAKVLSERLGRKATISTILQHPSVAQLATVLFGRPAKQVHANGTIESGFSIREETTSALRTRFGQTGVGIDAILPCTPLQEAMLAAKGDGAYYNSMVLELKISPTQIKESWESMLERHGILRSCFMSTDDPSHPFVQVVLERTELPWQPSSTDSTMTSCLENLKSIVGTPVDSMTPPFALQVAFEGETPYLCFLCHHAMYDGVAMSTLLAEIEELVTGGSLDPPVSYETFLHEALALPESTDKFWTDQFHDFKPVRFSPPEDYGSHTTPASHTVLLDMPLDELETRTHSLGLSLSSVSQAVWANILSIATGTSDVCFGNVMNGRSVPVEDVSRLVAPCFNTVPLRVDVSEHAQGTELLRHFHRFGPTVMQYQFTPLRRVQKLVGQGHGQGLFDTLLLFQPSKRELNPGVWEVVLDDGGMDVPLVCEICPDVGGNKVEVNLYYDGSCFPRQFVTAVGDTVNYLMSFLVKFPSSALRQFHDLSEEIQRGLQLVKVVHYVPAEAPSAIDDTGAWSDVELKIRRVLSQLSSVPLKAIGKKTTIFQLGLDSINAVQVAGLLRKEGLTVTATEILSHPTCDALAKRLLQKPVEINGGITGFDILQFQKRIDPLVRPALPKTGTIDGILPCTPVQGAMLTEFVQSAGRNYFNYVHVELDKGIHLSSVLEAWESVPAAHAILRVGFVPLDSQDYQYVPYAMVKYGAQGWRSPVSTFTDPQRFSVQKWKLDMAQEVVSSLHEALWRVALIQYGDRVSMHLAIHHALYDAHSLQRILDDLARTICGGKLEEAIPVERALGDVLGLVEKSGQGDAQTFWSALAEDAIVNDFPVMTPLRVEHTEMLSSSRVSALTFDELLRATRDANISIQAALQAAWTRVLSSYQGEDSVIFGTVMSGRVTESLKDAVFPCITTVPVIARNTSSNEDLLRAMMDFNSGLHKHQFSRLTDIQRWLGHSGRRLFDTLLVYQRFPETEEVAVPWNVVEDEGVVDYPVSIEVEPQRSGAVKFRMTFRNDVLPQEQASLMMAQLEAALHHLVVEPRESGDGMWAGIPHLAARLPSLAPELPSQVVLLHQFVESQASSQPQKFALEFVHGFNGEVPVSRSWTFSELNETGNRVAAIVSSQVSPGSIVAIHFDKCPEAYFSILGILKAGCSFLALDPAAPRARKEFIMSDSKAAALLVTHLSGVNFTSPSPVLEINEASIAEHGNEFAGVEISRESTCYCLYTSGTTGVPKGCEITHDNAVQAMLAFQELFKGHWDGESRCLQFASLHFDVSVLEQYWSWSVGIRVVSAPRDLVLDDLEGTISRLGITHIDLTPSLAGLVRPEKVPSLWRGVFITGGEQLKQEILDAWGPKGIIYNAYGPTEATIGVTMRKRVPSVGRPVNIGQQFPNVGTYVFRQGTEELVPRGGMGELCVSGRLVGKGYLGREELTAEKFPVLEHWKERIYRTGDLVRLLHDGSFDFLGRADDQVKLRGQRLQLGEIDHAIGSGVAGIRDVSTLVVKHSKTGKDILVSFVVPLATRPRDEGELAILSTPETLGLCREAKEACKAKVPGYMVPSYIIPLPFIPLSRNNKAEVKQLRMFFATLSTEDLSSLSAPGVQDKKALTEMGRAVVRLLAELTGYEIDAVGGETSIFDLGLDSISIPRFSRLLKREGIPASPEVILKNPAVGDLVRALQEVPLRSAQSRITEAKQGVRACGLRYRGVVCRELGVEIGEVEYVVPCTGIQEGMVSRALASGMEGGAYFNRFCYELREGVDVERLRGAWESAVGEFAVLRTRFVATQGGFVQVALRAPGMQWRESTSSLAEAHEEQEMLRRDWIDRNSANVVSPLEFIVYRGQGDTSRANTNGEINRRNSGRAGVRVVVHIFHGLYDGNSFDTVLRYVSAVYRGEKPTTGPLFVDVLPLGPLWGYGFCREFWARHLDGWRATEIPTKLGQSNQDYAGKLAKTGEAPADPSAGPTPDILVKYDIQTEDLERVRRTLGVTLQSVVFGLWLSTLRKYVSDAVTTGIIVSGRLIDADNVENCVGPLFNTLPYFAQPSQDDTWESLIRRCHEFSASVSSFQHAPLREIQKWCSNGKALFDNLFAFQVENGEGMGEEEAGETLWEEIEEVAPRADYPLAFEGTVKGGTLTVVILASGRVMGEDQVAELLRLFSSGVKELVENYEASIGLVTTSDAVGQTIITNGDHGSHDSTRTPLSMSSDLSDDALLFLREICDICGLDTNEIFADQTLANLGLDSIDTVKLTARLRSKGLSLTTSQIATCANLGEMMSLLWIRGSSSVDGDDGTGYEQLKASLRESVRDAGFEDGEIEDVLPPTPLQETMISQMLQTECQQYFNHDLLEVGADVDIERLADAWETVWKRSPVLRTIFVEVADPEMDFSLSQVVLRPRQLRIERKILSDIVLAREVMDATRGDATRVMARDKLFRLHILTAGDKNYVLLSISHALYDGWSLALLHRDVEAAYRGQVVGRPSPEIYLRGIYRASHESGEFWSQSLADARPTLVSAVDRDETSLHRAETVSNISTKAVAAFGKKHGVSMQVLGQACWVAVLGSMAASLDIAFGVVLSGRDFEGAEEVMFPTMNTVAARYVLHGTVVGFLRYMEETMAGIREHQAYPLRKALPKGQQLFNTLFLFQKAPFAETEGRLMSSVESDSAVEYPVCVELEVVGEELVWRTACQGEYFDAKGAEMLLYRLDRVLGYLLESPEEDVLKFDHPAVSICGLDPVQLQEEEVIRDDRAIDVADEAWSDMEAVIRDVIALVSGAERTEIKKSDTLYSVGLDSISAIKVAANLRRKRIRVSVRELVTAESIREVAVVASLDGDEAPVPESDKGKDIHATEANNDVQEVERYCSAAGIDSSAHEVEDILPALPVQVYMISTWQNSRGSVFFPTFRYRLTGEIRRERVQEAWRALVQETPLLRTCFIAGVEWAGGEWPCAQVVLGGGEIVERRARVLWNGGGENGARENNVGEHELVRLSATNEDGGWLLGIRIHHALYDAVSLSSMLNRFAALCGGAAMRGVESSAWRSFTRLHVESDVVDARKEFWTGYLSGVQSESGLESELGSTVWISTKRTSHFVKGVLDVTRAKGWCAKVGVSLQALFFAAYATVLGRRDPRGSESGGSVVFGVYLANRSDVAVSDGYPTLNIVPLRVRVTGDAGDIIAVAREVQRDVHAITREENVGVGLWEVEAWTGIKLRSFVNFIGSDEGSRGVITNDKVELGAVDDEGSTREGGWVGDGPGWLRANKVVGSFPAAVDLEASTTGDELNIGVFAPDFLLDGEGARALVEDIGGVMNGVE
ncbi:related to non-ribosomal peptide synthetase [Cephalotrichum gorgonifer]|uniref:Related to non-ribosomal peptide synthetase n=1 Tax=Cephalotrichum gorgonifer TaxID=2041049 RepID=A0AAE8SXD4_9PEZI|nr:related to non-ribosomal peptide synthetase [Cephalotrichum gorgonifer]